MSVVRMQDLDLAGKRVLVRVDFNVPIAAGKVSSDARIRAALPTIQQILQAGGALMLMSHLGRPQEGVPIAEQPDASLKPVAEHLATLLGQPVRLQQDWIDGVEIEPGQVVLLENVRTLVGENKDDAGLAAKMAALCDVFVMDAFGTAHRAQASTHGVALAAKQACAGPLLSAELEALARALQKPYPPVLAIVGGSKVSTKLTVLEALAEKCDRLIVGGGIANTFLAAKGHPVGRSLYEPDMLDMARRLLDRVDVPLPVDVVVADSIDADQGRVCGVDEVAAHEAIFDVGPATADLLAGIVREARTIIWNGPVGVFEKIPFAEGTRVLAQAIADSPAFSLAGGGDTLAAIDDFGVGNGISYISTGGGAFLEFVEGKTLPAVAALEARAAQA